jgi:hypothetical protein
MMKMMETLNESIYLSMRMLEKKHRCAFVSRFQEQRENNVCTKTHLLGGCDQNFWWLLKPECTVGSI